MEGDTVVVLFLRKASDLVKKRTAKTAAQNLMISNCTESRTFTKIYGICILFFMLKIY